MAKAAGFLELLGGNAQYRRLYVARTISLLGDWFNTLAVLALLREVGGVDARAFGWVLILKMLPALFMTPFAGVLADRVPRKLLMIAMDVVRGVIVSSMIALYATGALAGVPPGVAVVVLYGLVALQSACFAVAEPARNAVLPDLVAVDDLVTANALNAATWSLMFTVGTALGGVVTAQFGWGVALAIDATTYAISAVLLAGLVVPPQPVRSAATHAQRSFAAGVRYLTAHPRLWTLALAKAGWSLAGGITLVLTILGERVYRFEDDPGGILAVTILYMSRGLGTGLGPIVSRRLCGADIAAAERIIGWSFAWGGLCYVLLAHASWLPLAALLVVLAHLGGATVWVFSTVRLQALVPTEVRGRVFACEQATWTLSMSASTYGFGALIDKELFPLSGVVLAVGGVLLLPATLWWLRTRRLGDPTFGEVAPLPDGSPA